MCDWFNNIDSILQDEETMCVVEEIAERIGCKTQEVIEYAAWNFAGEVDRSAGTNTVSAATQSLINAIQAMDEFLRSCSELASYADDE